MKKLISVIVVIMVLFSASLAEDYSSMTVEELHTIQDSIRNELLRRELVAGDKILLFETDGISLYLTGEHSDLFGSTLRLETITINDTDREINIYSELSVNGWDVSCSWHLDANPKKKSKGYIDFNISKADISTYEEIEEIEFRFTYWFDNDKHTKLEPITIHFPMP